MLKVGQDGNAPSGATVGNTVQTGGGNYTIVSPNTEGAKYNPSSGHWSVKSDELNKSTLASAQTTAKGLVDDSNKKYQDSAYNANLVSDTSAKKQMEFNKQEAQKNRDWQEMMSNTAHQRQVKDLIKAGLNPVLSAMQGTGASVGSGAQASGSNYQGQKADVDISASSVFSKILDSVLMQQTQREGYNNALDIAKIQAGTALQTANISSAAQMYSANQNYAGSKYGADKSYQSNIDTRNPANRLFNELLSGNSAKLGSGIGQSFDAVKNFLTDTFKKDNKDNKKSLAW